MSVSGIGSSSFFESPWQGVVPKVQKDFQQLGQDLQAGNLSAAQSDLATIEEDAPNLAAAAGLAPPSSSSTPPSVSLNSPTGTTTAASSTASSSNSSTSSTSNDNPILQAFEQLASDLQSGNLSASQQDFSTLQQDVQSQASQFHHHHDGQNQSGDSSNSTGNQQSGIVQTFQQLLKDLQSGNTTGAQQAYTTLEQDFQQFAKQQGLTTQSDGSASNASSAISAPPATDTAAVPDSGNTNSVPAPYSISIQLTEINISVNA